jgi:two-component system cell cycle response regulator CpdR
LEHETILVVDEYQGTEAAKAILVDHSFRVLTAAAAEPALKILESEERVGMVLCEYLLPGGGSGATLAARIRVCYPASGVLLMTSLPNQQFNSSIPVLVKPFTATALLHRVEGLLAENRKIAESLKTAFAWNRAAKEDLDLIQRTLQESIRQSRRDRCTRFCDAIRQPGAFVPTILVAEDDEILRYTICYFLLLRGFHVIEAADGLAALNQSRNFAGSIELLLTDIQMPGLNGLDLMDLVNRERPLTSVIAMTGDDVLLARQTLHKPFELEDMLVEVVGTLIRQ